MTNFKTKFAYFPVRMARHLEADEDNPFAPTLEFIGWVWWRTVPMVNNLNNGWIVILDSAPIKPRCRKCGQVMPE